MYQASLQRRSPPDSPQTPRPVASALLSIGAVLLTIAAVEVGMRAFDYEPLRELAAGKDLVLRPSDDVEIGYELVPGSRGRAFRTDVVVNQAGFRGPEARGGSDLRQVLSVGDSIAFGSELPAGTAYPDLLRTLLQVRDPRFELQNLALSGYDTVQEVAVLERRGLIYDPEVVIVGFCLNDAGVVSANAEYLRRLEGYRASFWISHLRIAQFFATRMDRLRGRSFEREQNRDTVFRATYEDRIDPLGVDERELAGWMKDASRQYPSDWYRDPVRVGRIRYAFRRLAELSARGDFKVLVVVFPWLESDSAGEYPHQEAHQIVAYEAQRQGFGLLDLQGAFAAVGLMGLRNDPEDPTHPSSEGHRIAAREIAIWLDAAGWLTVPR